MVQATPAWIWKIFTILIAIASPKGDYGHPGSHRPDSPAHAFPWRPRPTHSQVTPSSTKGDLPSASSQSFVASPVNTITPLVPRSSAETGNPTLTSSPASTPARPSSTAPPIPEQKCPEGSSWFVVEDAMNSVDKNNWDLDAANHAKINFDDGMQMTLNQSALYVTLTSKHSWLPPVTVEAQIKSTGVGGVPSTLTMKGKGDTGAEIDLELVAYQLKNQQKPTYHMQLPIWKPSGQRAVKLKKDGSELAVKTSNGCYEDKANPSMSEWAYAYPNYDARAWTAYKLEWFRNQIKWYTEGLERVAFDNKKASSYPSTPLPLQIGPWAISKDSKPNDVTWAGAIDWAANPNPAMSLKNVRIAGCRAN